MLLIYLQGIFQLVCFLQCVAYRVKTTVSSGFCCNGPAVKCGGNLSCDSALFLLEMNFVDAVRLYHVLESFLKQVKNLIRVKLFVKVIGNTFGCVAHCLTHFRRKVQAVFGLQDVAYASFTGLAVDTDNVCVIVTSNIGWVDWQIGNGPAVRVFFLDPVHAFCDGILMRTGEGCKYKSAAIWASLSY